MKSNVTIGNAIVAVAVVCSMNSAEGAFQCRSSMSSGICTAREASVVHRNAGAELDALSKVHVMRPQGVYGSMSLWSQKHPRGSFSSLWYRRDSYADDGVEAAVPRVTHDNAGIASAANPVFGLLRIRRRTSDNDSLSRPKRIRKRRESTRRRAEPHNFSASSSTSSSLTNSRSGSLSRVLENSITARLERWSTHALNLRVLAKARPLTLIREGAIGSDFKIQFDSIAFHNIRISGGGVMYINDMTLDWLRFFPLPRRWATAAAVKKRPRFVRPFEFHARNFVFEKDDIVQSSCIRNGLQNLFNRILNRNLGFHSSKVQVESVDVMPDEKKLFCRCVAITPLGSKVPFEIRTGLGVTGDGHILTFPKMELSLHPETTNMFMPILPEIHLDVGHNANIESIVFAGKGDSRTIRINAKVTVTPKMGARHANHKTDNTTSRRRRRRRIGGQEKMSTTLPTEKVKRNLLNQRYSKLSVEQQKRQGGKHMVAPLHNQQPKQQEKQELQEQQPLKHYQYERPIQPQVAPSPDMQHSFLAHFACDVGMWVTNLGNFTK